jgi:hypothetical protein
VLANSRIETNTAMTIRIPPIVGVLDLCRVSWFRSAWSNSGRSPIFRLIRKRIIGGPSSSTVRKLTTAAPAIRRIRPL